MTADPPPIASIPEAIASLRFLADRTPFTTDEEATGAFARLAEYRDGAIFVGHWAGTSEWERHAVGDEIVAVAGGETTITMIVDGQDRSTRLGPGDLVVVPRGTWHRFHTPDRVEVVTVTPQPTDHRVDRPE